MATTVTATVKLLPARRYSVTTQTVMTGLLFTPEEADARVEEQVEAQLAERLTAAMAQLTHGLNNLGGRGRPMTTESPSPAAGGASNFPGRTPTTRSGGITPYVSAYPAPSRPAYRRRSSTSPPPGTDTRTKLHLTPLPRNLSLEEITIDIAAAINMREDAFEIHRKTKASGRLYAFLHFRDHHTAAQALYMLNNGGLGTASWADWISH